MNNIKLDGIPNPENTIEKHGLISTTITHNGIPTDKQAITYKGNFIQVFSKGYKPVAHEDIYAAAKEVGEKLDITPQLTKVNHGRLERQRWYKPADFGEAELSTPNGGQMIATFLDNDKGVDVTGEGDFVRAGVTIIGSIDGSKATKIIPSTERGFCFNRMYHLKNVGEISNESLVDLDKNIQQGEAQLQKMKVRWNHSKNFQIADFKTALEECLNFSKNLITQYQDFKNEKVTQAMALELNEALGKRFMEEISWVESKKDEVKLVESVDKWQAFNDITRRLTHDDISKSMDSILQRYKKVDNIFLEQMVIA